MLEEIQKNIGYQFKNIKLLEMAFTHKSYANEHGIQSNEKLEFLGDSILEFISSEYLYENFKGLNEGEMTKIRATVVCEKSLYKIADKHNFIKALKVGKSEIKSVKTKGVSILGDSVEATIAAIYLDGGLEPAKKFILDNLIQEIDIARKNVGQKDYKTVLQEKMQEKGPIKIKYTILKEEGPDHDKKFTAEVEVEGKRLAIGEGKSKKEAEMQAAKKALGE